MRSIVYIVFFLSYVFQLKVAVASESDGDPFVVSHDSFEPFIWFDGEQSKGLYVDILKEAFDERLGIETNFQFVPWKRAQQFVKTGQSDAIIALAIPERLSYSIRVSEPIAHARLGLFTYAGHPKIKSISKVSSVRDLKGYSMISYFGDGWVINNVDRIDVKMETQTIESVLKMLAAKRMDVMVHTEAVALHNIKKFNLNKKIIHLKNSHVDSLQFHLLISKESKFLHHASEFNRVFMEMKKEGFLKKAAQKYY